MAALPLALAGALYLLGSARAGGWPVRRTAAFIAGLAALGAALQPALEAAAEERLSAHMVQHLALTLLAPPLLVAGDPVSLALRALPREGGRRLARLIRARPVRAVLRPSVAWALFTLVLVGSHVPAFYDAALRSEALHGVEHLLYLGTALPLWAAALGMRSLPRAASPLARVLLILAAMPPMTLVGVALRTVPDVAYPAYAHESATSALADQRTAGSIMWLGGTLPLAATAVAVGWSAIRREERRALARESRAAPGAGGAA